MPLPISPLIHPRLIALSTHLDRQENCKFQSLPSVITPLPVTPPFAVPFFHQIWIRNIAYSTPFYAVITLLLARPSPALFAVSSLGTLGSQATLHHSIPFHFIITPPTPLRQPPYSPSIVTSSDLKLTRHKRNSSSWHWTPSAYLTATRSFGCKSQRLARLQSGNGITLPMYFMPSSFCGLPPPRVYISLPKQHLEENPLLAFLSFPATATSFRLDIVKGIETAQPTSLSGC